MSYPGELKLLRTMVKASLFVRDGQRADMKSMRAVLEAVERNRTVRRESPRLWKRVHARLEKARENDSVDRLCEELNEIATRLRKIRKKGKG